MNRKWDWWSAVIGAIAGMIFFLAMTPSAFGMVILREEQGQMVIELQSNNGTAAEPSWVAPTARVTPAVLNHLGGLTARFAVIVWNPGGQIVGSIEGDNLNDLLDQFNAEVFGRMGRTLLKLSPGRNGLVNSRVVR